jgi:hypothetical protein
MGESQTMVFRKMIRWCMDGRSTEKIIMFFLQENIIAVAATNNLFLFQEK